MSVEQCRELFTSFYGCDGGDIGSETKPSIWLCGIEWGGKSEDVKWFEKDISEVSNFKKLPERHTRAEFMAEYDEKIKYPFNISAFKLLAVIAGKKIGEYENFAKEVMPFSENSGYFKLNLYPLSFQKTDHSYWDKFKDELKRLTGFDSKGEYLKWIRQNRLPIMREEWARKYKPKLIVCVGTKHETTYDFEKAFGDENAKFTWEKVQCKKYKKSFRYLKNSDGTLVVNIPFFYGGAYTINGDEDLQTYANKIKTLLEA